MNGSTSAESGASAFKAPRSFIERHIAPFLWIQAALVQVFIGDAHLLLTVNADDADQALGQNAVQRRDEVVEFDAHIQKASQHVKHVVGVDRGEHQVSGEGRVDGDLGSFLIADFADHHLVRIVAQNGPQAAGEREALLLVDRDLGDALDLIFHRIFDGDDFVFVVLDLAERGVERCGLAGTGGPGDQHHAVRFLDVAGELDLIRFGEADDVKAELGKLLAHGLFVQHTEHGVFAMDGGHDGDAEIDETAFVTNAETAVLRDAAFGDIEFAHDLDARNDGGMPVLRDGRHGVVQHAIDAVLDGYFLVSRFNVNVTGAAFERVEDRSIHQLDDRRDVAIGRREPVYG